MNELLNAHPIAPTAVSELLLWLRNFVSPQTQQTYATGILAFARHFGIRSAEGFRQVTRAHIIAWREELVRRGVSERTIHNRLSSLSSLFKHLCDSQAVARNPVEGVKRPTVRQDEVKTQTLTPPEVRRLLEAPDPSTFRGLRDRAVLHLLCYTGCRISEVCSLQVRDWFEDGGYSVLDFRVKGGKRNRLAIHPELQNALKAYLAVAPHRLDRNVALICGVRQHRQFQPLTRRQIARIFQRYARAVGLALGVTPHSTRATFITEALENHCPLEAVQRSVGHSRITTTQLYDKRHRKHRDSASFAVKY